MEAPDFWDNAEASQKKMKELKSMKDDMETYQNLITQKEDMETLIEMSYEENDPSHDPGNPGNAGRVPVLSLTASE